MAAAVVVKQKPSKAVKKAKVGKAVKRDIKAKKTKKLSQVVSTRVPKLLVEQAVAALLNYHKEKVAKKNILLGSDETIQLQIGLEVPPFRPSFKPFRILIPHPIHQVNHADASQDGLDEPEVCLIVKDDAKPMLQELIAQHPDDLKLVKKVLTLTSLRQKHAQHAQRRDLLTKYTHFLADDRILPMLTKALGKHFVQAKKLPVPIKVTTRRGETISHTILHALKATYFNLPKGGGNCATVAAATTGMAPADIVENILAVAKHTVAKIPRKWANVRNLAIKTAKSAALPIYNKTPTELRDIAQLAGLSDVWKVSSTTEETKLETKTTPKKRKPDLKSPLLRALKRKCESEAKDTVVEAYESDKRTKQEIAVVPLKAPAGKKAKPSKKSEAVKEMVHSTSTLADESKGRVRAEDTQPEAAVVDGSKHETTSENNHHPAVEKKAAAKTRNIPVRVVDKLAKNEATSNSKDVTGRTTFTAAKKFKGSKNGFCFKLGKQGLGYYLDVKPVVDVAAIQALTRKVAPTKGRRASKSPASKRKGKR